MDLIVNQTDYDSIITYYNDFKILERKAHEIRILLESRGISVLHGPNDIGYGFIVPNKRGEKPFLSSNYHSLVFKTNFNGLNINRDVINYNINPFQDQFNNWLNENGNIEDKINGLTKRAEELTKNTDNLFNNNELNNINEELRYLKIKCLDGAIIKRQANEFSKITPENKNIIKKYFEAIDDIVMYANTLNQLGKLINDCMIKYMPNIVNSDLDFNLIADSKSIQKIEECKSIMVNILSKYELYDNKEKSNFKSNL